MRNGSETDSNDVWSMKKLKSVSLVGITLIALAHAGWAAGHGGGGGGGGGGGFHGGGGGFHGGGFRGGGFRGGYFGGGFGGARYAVPAGHFSNIRPGHAFSSTGARPSYGQPVYSGRAGQSVNRSVRGTTPFSGQHNQFRSPGNRVGQRSPVARTPNQRALSASARNHIFARHEANWHRDWDRRHAHFHHGHFFVFNDGFWFGLDDGFFPWDYYPYYAYDYYPYDYYPGGVQPGDNTEPVYNGAPVADATVQAVQTRLTQAGYYNGPVDGIFGPSTRDAVAKYQIAKQLNVTGSLSPDTLQSLALPKATAS